MSNNLYTKATGKESTELTEEQARQAEIAQHERIEKSNWKVLPQTRKLVEYLKQIEQNFLIHARSSAYAGTDLETITKHLIKSKAINEVLEYINGN
jgi:adenosyl cobinamide kinase/adenosyl cobinamide phosphate guanylyltransferase